MIDLELDESERLLQRTARRMLDQHVDLTRIAEAEASELGYDQRLWDQLVQSQLTDLHSSGDGRGEMVAMGVLMEECGRAGLASPLLQTLAVNLVLDRLPATSGAGVAELARDVGLGRRRAVLVAPADPDRTPELVESAGGLHVEARPITVEWAHLADVLVAPLRRRSDPKRWAVAAVPASAPGVVLAQALSMDNERVARVDLSAVQLRATDLLCADVDVESWAGIATVARLLRAAEMVGGMRRVTEMTRAYVGQRHQFGKPIGSFQAVQHMLADMLVETEGAWLATYEALWASERQAPSARRDAEVAAFFVGHAAEEVTKRAAQCHAAMGYMVEYPLHVFFRRAKAQQLRLGGRTLRLSAVAEQVLGHPVATPFPSSS